MWLIIFVIGLGAVVLAGFRYPIWWTSGACYVYFAIPTLEFGAPGAPYQAGLFAVGMLGSFAIYVLAKKWNRNELLEYSLDAVRSTIDSVREAVKKAFIERVAAGAPPHEAAHRSFNESEEVLLKSSASNSPAALQPMVLKIVRTTVQRALQAAEGTTSRILSRAQGTRGNLRVALAGAVSPEIDDGLDKEVEPTTTKALDELLAKYEEESDSDTPLGIPAYDGPLKGLLTNGGLWIHFGWIALTFIGLSRAIYSYDRGAGLPMRTVLLLIPMVAIIASVRTPRDFRIFSFAWVLGTWHIAMNGVTYFLRYGGRADNAGGQGGESNFLAAIIVTVAPVAFGLTLVAKSKFERVFYMLASGTFALGVLASGSRAGLLALVGGGGYWLLHTNRRGIAVGLSLFGTAAFLVVAPESFWERMGTILGPGDANPWIRNAVEPSKAERLELWHLAIREFEKYPVFGIGPGNFTEVSAQELPNVTDPYFGKSGLQTHNAWLQILSEYGIVGILVWGGGFFYSMYCHRRARQLLQNREKWRWFAAVCLGFEAGTLSSAMMLGFMSFHWYDYHYWHFIAGPLALQVARRVAARDDWLKPRTLQEGPAEARYGQRRSGGLDDIDLSEVAPMEPDSHR